MRISLPSLVALVTVGAFCENRDGACPPCDSGRVNVDAVVWISPNVRVDAAALFSDLLIGSLGPVLRYDPPFFGLHMTILYLCCHHPASLATLGEIVKDHPAEPLTVSLDDFGCNLAQQGSTAYLHALPTNQSSLFSLARRIEAEMERRDIPVTHPRQSFFHCTFARVDRDAFPIRDAVTSLQGRQFGAFTIERLRLLPHL